MMRYFFLFLCLVGSLTLKAQIYNPVTWSTTFEKVDNETFDLKFTADIDEGWYVYSQFIEEGGPIPTSFNFDGAGENYELVGDAKELSEHRKEGMDDIFGMNVIKFSEEVSFVQRIKVSQPGSAVGGYLEYMTCDDSNCLPPEQVDFSFDLPAVQTAEPTTATDAVGQTRETTEAAEPATSKEEAVSVSSATVGNERSPVKVQAELHRLSSKEFKLDFHASIDPGWWVYSQFLEGDGPVPTSIVIESPASVELLGAPEESGAKKVKEFDPSFQIDLIKLKEKATFSRKFRVEDTSTAINGYFEYMVCDKSRCLPPDAIPFQISLAPLSLSLGEVPAVTEEAPAEASAPEGTLTYGLPKDRLAEPVGQCGEATTVRAGSSYWSIFVLGFLGGLLALLTPCVFPMIPLTVSFFTKSSGDRRKGIANASMYGFFILLVYVLLSIPFHLMDSVNPDILNDISTNVWLNLAFFAIFVFFAFSFFGYYELTLPSSWTNKASSAEGIGGAIGIFFMALTLALVSFSCTGPILGSLLAGALTSDGGAWQLTAGMSGFGLALALPFALFAAFPSWMNSLPKSGGWLNTVKVTLGFLELALALKFLSNADLVKHWGILKIEPFLGIWILIFLGLGLYLFGLIRFPHDSPKQKISLVRKGLGALSMAFVLYLASGFLYNPQSGTFRSLKLLSGLAPPAGYSFIHPSDCPQNLNCFKDLDQGLAHARETGKPVMIDFTGYACVNCRKMEEHVWPENDVYSQLRDDYVLISLYVDDKKDLPADEQVVVQKATGGTRKLQTYGQKWAHFQAEYFGANSQPFYALITPEGELLNNPVGYTPDPQEYAQFLNCGQETFQQLVEQKSTKRQLGLVSKE